MGVFDNLFAEQAKGNFNNSGKLHEISSDNNKFSVKFGSARSGLQPEISQYSGDVLGDSKFDYGIPVGAKSDIGRIRGELQPWYEQTGAMLNQAVTGEIIGGTLMSVGAILEAPEMVYNVLNDSDNEFHNTIFDLGKGLSDWAQEATPIYQTGERFGDPGYWFQNGVSVASSLSMMLPGMAAAKGAQLVGKGLKLGTTASGLLQTGVGALTMRHAEGFREASGVHDSIYQQGMQALSEGKLPNMTEEDVKKAASNAAALDYNMNYMNLAFDIIQLGSILKPLGNFTRNVGLLDYKLAKAAGKLPTSKLGKAAYWMAEPGKGLLEQSTEGLEEVWNTVSQFEGERRGKQELGLQPEDSSTLLGRISGYLGKEEALDSFIWGVTGGAIFSAAGKPISKALGIQSDNTIDRKLSELANRENTIKQYAQHVNAINNGEIVKDVDGSIISDYSTATDEDKTTLVNDLRGKMAFKLGLDASKAGNVDLLLEQLNDKDLQNTLIQNGLASQETINQDIKSTEEEVIRAENTYKKHYQRLFEKPIDSRVKDVLINKAVNTDARRYEALGSIKQLDSDYNKLYQEDGFIQLNPDKAAIDLTIYQEGLAVALMDLNDHLQEARRTNNSYAEEKINKIISNVEKKLKVVGNKSSIDPNLIDRRLGQNIAQKEILNEWANIYSEDLANIDKSETIKKTIDEIKDSDNKIKEALFKSKKIEEESAKNERLDKQAEIIDPEDYVPSEEFQFDEDFSMDIEMQEEAKADKKEQVQPDVKIATEVNPEARQMLNQLGYTNTQIDELSVKERKDILTRGIPKEDWDILKKHGQELRSEDNVRVVPDDEYYDASKAKIVSQEFDNISNDLKNSNGSRTVDSDNNTIYENSKIESGHSALGHKDRAYKREEVTIAGVKTVKYIDEDDALSEDAPLDLLNPDKYKVGEEVEFIVEDTDDIKIYDPSKEGKEVIAWGAYKKLLQDKYPNQDITKLQDYKNNIPIKLSGLDAYLHSDNWISEENVTGNIQDDKLALRKIRNGIFEKGSYKTSISNVSNGVLFLLANNATNTAKEAVGTDSNYIIAVGSKDGLKVSKDSFFNEPVINSKIVSGATYMVVKTPAGNNIAITLDSQKIGNSTNSEDSKRLILNAIQLFLDNDSAGARDIFNITGYDVTDLDGLGKFIKLYLNPYKTNGMMLKDMIRSMPTNTTNMYFSINKGVIEFFDGDLTRGGGKVYYVSKKNQSQRELFMSSLEKSLDGFYLNTNIDYFERNKNIPIFDDGKLVAKPYRDFIMENLKTRVKGNKIGEKNGKDIYSYSLQPVYRFDFSEFLGEDVVEGEVKKEVTSIIEEIDVPIKTSGNELSDDTMNLLDSFDSWSDLPYVPNTNKVEDLSKKVKNSHLKC